MIGLIVARSRNNVIGKKGRIPWQIQGEQKQFKELTTGNIVIMGRKTYEEIGHPLPKRKTIVLSRSKKFEGDDLMTAASMKEALKLALTIGSPCSCAGATTGTTTGGIESGCPDIFIAGGYEAYKEALPLVDVMYITEIDLWVEDGDTFFPAFDQADFEVTEGESDGDEIKYTRTIYTRRKAQALQK